nr:chemotaxis protein CheW [Thaumasiovibrio subtropicus]
MLAEADDSEAAPHLVDDQVEPFSEQDLSIQEDEQDEFELHYQPQPKLAEAEDEVQPDVELLDFDLSEVERLLGQLESAQTDIELEVSEELELAEADNVEREVEVETAVEMQTSTYVDDHEDEADLEAQFAEVARLEALAEARAFNQQLDEIHQALEEEAVAEPEIAVVEPAVEIAEPQPVVEALVDTPATTAYAAPDVDIDTAVNEPETDTETAVELETQNAAPPAKWDNIQPDGDFQVLFFEVNDVTFAVPLAQLGGIHRLEQLNNLPGKPPWYLGLHTTRNQQFDVVDTAYWAMPDMLIGDEYKENYSYIVMLGASRWGMACDALQGTQTLTGNNIRWREQAGKRPWLAGMVKEKMCALIHVEALIAMLNAGLDVKAMA